MSDEIIHATWKRSWWDGSITALCGQRAKAGTYRETWFLGGITCPGCRAVKKQEKR